MIEIEIGWRLFGVLIFTALLVGSVLINVFKQNKTTWPPREDL